MLLSKFLIEQINNIGVCVNFGENVSNVAKNDDYFTINGHLGKNIIWAIGAKDKDGSIPNNQSIGISSIIRANLDIEQNYFHYWYYSNENDRYFWIFPVGKSLWNVGVWCRNQNINLKKDYYMNIKSILSEKIIGDFEYVYKPRIEFLGHNDQRKENDYMMNGIGDFAGRCNPANGGGIIYAIESAIDISEKIIYKR